MTTAVFLTIDTEFAWRHHTAGYDAAGIHQRSIEPAGVGVAYQLDRLNTHGLKACFFVDPMPALVFGLDPFRRTVDAILTAGQEVQLHLHPGWTDASVTDRKVHARSDLSEYDRAEQRALIEQANALLVAAGAPQPVAFRAGSYAANDDTLAVLAALGFQYDSSHNGAQAPSPSGIGLDHRQIAPVLRDVIEVPVTVIEDKPGKLRTVQICALSTGEMYDALEHAAVCQHTAMTIVSHGFELANRSGTRANAVHVRRFEALCGVLAEMRDVLPTRHFADRPALALDQPDRPLGPDTLRTRWRQAEQLWSNWVSERKG
ncbi:polysaccharide deacetylase family protein [Sphingomonas sp. Leaf17]|uniref:polysaccharide deacetylase family protein n=1 Tax=Sphingomonas sp. Leaf17 TaxID=1735683 RepID=UPI0009EB7097|nr:polysaccharide deacetylase family protein [Sphingomonas sp. Leaf17]